MRLYYRSTAVVRESSWGFVSLPFIIVRASCFCNKWSLYRGHHGSGLSCKEVLFESIVFGV